MTMQTRKGISFLLISRLVLLLFLAVPAQAFAQGAPTDGPLLIEPADLSEIIDTTTAIVLAWGDTNEASTYEMQHFFSQPVDGQEPIPLKTKVLSDLSAEILVADLLDLRATLDPTGDSTFHWRVRARNADGEGPWSEVWTYTIVPLVTPQITPIETQIVDEEGTLVFNVDATSPTGSILMYSIDQSSLDSGISIDPDTGALSWTPDESQGPGSYDVTVTVTDEEGNAATETFTIIVNEVNLPPVLAEIPDQTADVGTELTLTAIAIDPDIPANGLLYTLDQASLDAGINIDQDTGVISWTPTADQDQMTFEVTVTVTDDGEPAASDSKTFTIQVGTFNPAIDPVDAQVVDEETDLFVDINATSATGNVLSYSLDSASLDAGMIIDPATGLLNWTPTEAQGPGTFEVTVLVSDDEGRENMLTFTIDVNEVNLPPTLEAIADQTAEVGSEFTLNAVASDPDLPANTLTYNLDQASLDAGISIDPSTGAISWTPAADQDQTAFSVTVTVTDDGEPTASDSQTFVIQVGSGGNNPIIDFVDAQSIDEEATLTVDVNATSPIGSTLAYSLDQASLDAGLMIDPSSGEMIWTPDEAQGPGVFDVIVTTTDETGNTASQQFSVTVNEVNLAPVLAAIEAQISIVGIEKTFTATATDPDIPENTLTFSLDQASLDAGMAIDSLSGSFLWIPSIPGVYDVVLTVTDDGVPALFDTTTVILTVDDNAVVTSTTPQTAPFCSAAAEFDLNWTQVAADEFTVQFATTRSFSTVVEEISTTTPSAKAPLASLDFDQTYYWRVITSLNGMQSEPSPATSFSRWREQIDIEHTLSYQSAITASDFRMISVPGQSAAVPFASTFTGRPAPSGELRPSGDWDWSIWRDNSANASYEGYIEQVLDENASFSPGVGFWAISTSTWQVAGQSINNVPLDVAESRYFAIPLNQGNDTSDARWTMIGNPFEFPVLWQDIVDENDLTESFDLWDWTGNGYVSASVLEPYKGYYYFNSKNDPSLRIPCVLSPIPGGTVQPPAPDITTLAVSLHEGKDAISPALSEVKISSAEGAEDGFDQYDRVVPPAFFEKNRITLVNRKLEKGYPYLVEEARASFGSSQVFDVELKAEPNTPVYLHVDGLDKLQDREVYLFDDALGQAFDLHLNNVVLLEPAVDITGLRLLIGDLDFIQSEEANLLPDGFKLKQSYPNPFAHQATIEYALPEAEYVTLEVYNLLGQRVRNLAQGEQDAGYHQVIWDGTSDTGDAVASGVYMYVFRSPSYNATQRIVRVR